MSEFTLHNGIPTSELKVGDVVLCHGMRCLVTQPLNVSQRGSRKVFYTHSLVTNRAEVPTSVVPRSFTYVETHEAEDSRWEEHRWTIQGNDGARWYVQRPASPWQVVTEEDGTLDATGPQPEIASRPAADGGTARLRPNGRVDAVDGMLYEISPGFLCWEEFDAWVNETLGDEMADVPPSGR